MCRLLLFAVAPLPEFWAWICAVRRVPQEISRDRFEYSVGRLLRFFLRPFAENNGDLFIYDWRWASEAVAEQGVSLLTES